MWQSGEGRREEKKAEWENGGGQEDFQGPSNSEHLWVDTTDIATDEIIILDWELGRDFKTLFTNNNVNITIKNNNVYIIVIIM